ncbi:hypothetical protein [Nocardioides flavescens]|uniref:Major tropism determinant N-terminal domain-containing protein n=1 Tax=Nocardioides flavescens TaxID=2691959 RepID=A0A6L7F0F1_9ACTN|nr:hypothetical protein [Nocardioides flavescens]
MTTIKLRRGTTAQWQASNPVLAAGEPAFDITTGFIKMGDGETAWADLPSFLHEDAVAALIADSTTPTTVLRTGRSAPTSVTARALGRAINTGDTAALQTTRTSHTFVEDAVGLRVLVTGWGNGEGAQPGDLTVRAALEYAGVVTPFTFDGQQATTIAPGSHRVSDPLGVFVTAGSTGFLRAERSVAGGGSVLSTAALRASLGEGTATSTSAVYGAASGFSVVADENTPAWAPLAILADGSAGRSVAFFGDSLSNAQRDAVPEDGGYLLRAVSPDVGVLRLNGGGGTAGAFIGNGSGADSGRRRLALARHASYAWVEYGANDLNGGASLTTIQANLTRLWTALSLLGLPVWQSTITPWSSSSDGWTTVEGQTPYSKHPTRIALNDWIRTKPAPLTGFFEVADVVESERNSGKWALTDGAPAATDGIHPSGPTYAKIAAAIRPGVLSAFA